MNAIKPLIVKHQKLLTYVGCSLATAILETAVGWCLLNLTSLTIVIANTVAILIGAAAHYFLTLALVFKLRSNVQSALAYGITFALGIVLQNLIIWLSYDHLLASLSDFWRYLLSKGLSLAIPFFLMYYLRSVINQAIQARREKKDENDRGDAALLQ